MTDSKPLSCFILIFAKDWYFPLKRSLKQRQAERISDDILMHKQTLNGFDRNRTGFVLHFCKEYMSQKAILSNFPLPEALTHRVVSYLSVFRLLISLILLYAFFTDLVALPIPGQERHWRDATALLFCHGDLPGH